MKKYISRVSVLLLLLTACSQENDLESLRKKRVKIKEQLFEVEAKIAELDTVKNYNLPIVGLTNVIKGDFSHFIEVQGNVVADKNILINPEFNGVVDQINVVEGQDVKKGTILMKLNTDLLDQQINELKQNLDLAKYVKEKQEKLWKEEIGSELEYKKAISSYNGLLESISTLQEQKKKATIRAPFSGVVNDIYPNLGEMVNTSMSVIRLVNLNGLKVVSDISESYVSKINKGTLVNVFFESQNLIVDGISVSRTGMYINPENRTFIIEVDLPDTLKVLPNLIAKLSIRDDFKKDVLLIPTHAIMQDNKGNNYVFTLDTENKVVKTSIEVGRSYKDQTMITNGLSVDDKIISVGNRGVRQGDLVSFK